MTAMELAHPMRHRDSSDESPATKTGASDAPPQFVRRIACDHRERPSGVPTALAAHPNVELTLHHLRLGDYRVNDTLIVERKTLTDFAQSVTRRPALHPGLEARPVQERQTVPHPRRNTHQSLERRPTEIRPPGRPHHRHPGLRLAAPEVSLARRNRRPHPLRRRPAPPPHHPTSAPIRLPPQGPQPPAGLSSPSDPRDRTAQSRATAQRFRLPLRSRISDDRSPPISRRHRRLRSREDPPNLPRRLAQR